MKKQLYIIALLLPTFVIAQVGINTNSPVEELHIAGASSNVRIEGLNSPNNTKNIGALGTSRVFVDAEGDLTLGDGSNNIAILMSPDNYLDDALNTSGSQPGPGNVVNQTGVGSGYTQGGWPRQIGPGLSTFELTKPAIVEINYSLSWEPYKSGNPLDDEHARVVQTLCYLMRMPLTSHDPANFTGYVTTDLDGVPLTLGYALGINGQFYNNGSTSGPSKNFHNTGTDYVKLPAGRYCPMFMAQLAVGNTGGTGAVKMQLGSGQDEVQVIAHYYN